MKHLTDNVLNFFDILANDAPDWSGNPLFGGNHFAGPKEKGYLTNLKQAGLVTTDTEPNENCSSATITWVYFTDEGADLAKERTGVDPREC